MIRRSRTWHPAVEETRLHAMRTFPRTLAVAFAAVALACTHAGGRSAQPGGRTVTVLVYNIHAGKDAARADNLPRVAALVRSTGADLVLLQEVDRNTARSGPADQPAILSRLAGYPVAFGRTIDFGGGQYGVALLSRWPIRADTLVPLLVTPPPGQAPVNREQRGVLVAEVASPAGPITVLNTHLDASGDDTWRVQEIRTVLEALARARGRGGPVLLGGDFNARPESAVHQPIRQAGFRDAWEVCGRGDGLTFPADSAVRRIDYLYLPPEATCEEARVLASDASDHRPLLVRVRLR